VFKKVFKKIKKTETNLILFLAGLVIFFGGVGVIWVFSFKIPDLNSFEDRKIVNSTKIYDRTGEFLLYDIHRDIRRTNIPFDQMGANIKNATVAVEDSDFYNHKGIRISSIIRASLTNLLGTGKTQGGSTITQQLVKNTLLNPKKTFGRKITYPRARRFRQQMYPDGVQKVGLSQPRRTVDKKRVVLPSDVKKVIKKVIKLNCMVPLINRNL